MSNSAQELIINIIATVLGGVVLTFILFAINEWILPKKNISGEWEAVELIEDASTPDLIGIKLNFKLHILQTGYNLDGSGEKISETRIDTPKYFFEREKRVTIYFTGYMERKYLSRTIVYLNIIEKGRLRESRTSFALTFENNSKLNGRLISTAANAKGRVELTKTIS